MLKNSLSDGLEKAEGLNEGTAFKYIVRDKLGDKVIFIRRLAEYPKQIGRFEVVIISFN